MDLNIILKYKRERDCWLCSVCESENDIANNKCSVCKCNKSSALAILNAWSADDERILNSESTVSQKKVPDFNALHASETPKYPKGEHTKIFKDIETPRRVTIEKEKSNSRVAIAILAVILVIVFVALVSLSGSAFSAGETTENFGENTYYEEVYTPESPQAIECVNEYIQIELTEGYNDLRKLR